MITLQQLTEDMKQAMRSKDSVRLGVIRFLLAEIKNEQIDNGELSVDQIQTIISRQVKQMQEAIADYTKADLGDRVAEEQSKIAVLQEYLPKQLSDSELDAKISAVIAGMSEPHMGQVIAAVKEAVGATAQGGRVAQRVKQALST